MRCFFFIGILFIDSGPHSFFIYAGLCSGCCSSWTLPCVCSIVVLYYNQIIFVVSSRSFVLMYHANAEPRGCFLFCFVLVFYISCSSNAAVLQLLSVSVLSLGVAYSNAMEVNHRCSVMSEKKVPVA